MDRHMERIKYGADSMTSTTYAGGKNVKKVDSESVTYTAVLFILICRAHNAILVVRSLFFKELLLEQGSQNSRIIYLSQVI